MAGALGADVLLALLLLGRVLAGGRGREVYPVIPPACSPTSPATWSASDPQELTEAPCASADVEPTNERNFMTTPPNTAPPPPPPGWYPPLPPPAQKNRKLNKKLLMLFLGAVVGLIVIGNVLGSVIDGTLTDNKSTASSSASISSSATAAAAPTTTTKSPAEIQAEQAAIERARAAETARLDPSSYEVISPRDYAVLVKNPDAARGRKLVVYGYVTQFDAATGTAGFRANTAAAPSSAWYDYDVNSIVNAPAGQSNILTNVVEGDLVTMNVEVVGAYSYDTQIGGNTTAPQFQVNIITVTGSTKS